MGLYDTGDCDRDCVWSMQTVTCLETVLSSSKASSSKSCPSSTNTKSNRDCLGELLRILSLAACRTGKFHTGFRSLLSTARRIAAKSGTLLNQAPVHDEATAA